MTKPSEYMEAFFGVELNQKFEDMINDLHEIEDGLKKFSTELDKLEQEMDPSEFREMRREGKALIFEYGQEIKDAWQFLDFYLKSDKNTNQITLERDAYMKIYQIYKWDGADVRDLNTWIKELKEICEKVGLNARDLLNFKKLTAHPVPDEVSKFPVYAIDRQGYCLTSSGLDVVMHIDEVHEAMEERKGQH